jgi:hypothetical protein
VLLLACAILVSGASSAQLTTGIVEGVVRSADGLPETGLPIFITGATGFHASIRTNFAGEFTVALPHGRYHFSAASGNGPEIFAAALATTRLDLLTDGLGGLSLGGLWIDTTRARVYPEPFALHGVLLSREPSTVTAPLDFAGVSDHRLALVSQRAFSWTGTQFKLEGMDATDSDQPGRPVIMPDVQALDELAVRSGFEQTTSSSYATEIGTFLAEPGRLWHGSLQSVNTRSPLAASNLPSPGSRGLVQQSQYFDWFARESAQIGGPIGKRADLFAAATGQWSKQTEPLEPVGTDQRSKLLYGNVRGRFRATEKDSFDALYSGSRINLSDFGTPLGLESLVARRDSPSFVITDEFRGQGEVDHMDFLQAGWTRELSAASGLGAIQVRYGFATAHFDTSRSAAAETFPQSIIELTDGSVKGAPPMENLATRTRQEIEAAWQPGFLRHRITAGGGWRTQSPLNRITAPSDTNVITANGEPAFVVRFNTPLDSRAIIRTGAVYIADHWRVTPTFSIDAGVFSDFSRGSIPAQSSGLGIFFPPRSFPAHSDLIAWNSFSPRAGFAWQVPGAPRLVVRGMYFRAYAPLAGHYLDFGNPNSLSGSEYQWIDRNGDGQFQSGEQGPVILRFGGLYSSISPSLRRPYSDEFDVGGELRIAPRTVASIHLFRRDEKDRIAAINTGVPFTAFTPVTVIDPGDGTPNQSPDQFGSLTVYSQNPATFGQDRYLLTNPAGLRMLNTGFVANVRTEFSGFVLDATFVAEKAFGPTNPGDSAIENDAGVIGSLYMDPNTLVNATGRTYFDRGYIGKVRATYRLPFKIDLMSTADYFDGLVFARQLLITSLAQGPIVVAATLRGSPEGGNRAQYVLNWNLRAQRQFGLRAGSITAAMDAMNVLNAGQSIQENDVSGPSFIDRRPVAIQEPRSFRFLIRYDF